MTHNNKYKLTVLRYVLAPFNKVENQERLLKGSCFQASNQCLIRCSKQHAENSQRKQRLIYSIQNVKNQNPELVRILAILLKLFPAGLHLLHILGLFHSPCEKERSIRTY